MKLWLITIALGLACAGEMEAAPRVIKALVEEPVVQELMGGCSMKCAFAWTVEITEEAKPKATKVLNDEQASSFWKASGVGQGVGAKIQIAFPKRLPAVMEGEVPFYGVDLVNGVWISEEQWRAHGRLKKARLFYNGRALCDLSFADSRRWQRATFDDVMIRSGDVFVLEVLEIYPGEKEALAISELVLQGAH
jgi:hypothetical protein